MCVAGDIGQNLTDVNFCAIITGIKGFLGGIGYERFCFRLYKRK